MTAVSERLEIDASAIYSAAVRAVDPSRLLLEALHDTRPSWPVSIIAIGKAADGMAAGAVRHLERVGCPLVGGLVVSTDPPPAEGSILDPHVVRMIGDHPLPGPRSLEAARALERATREIEDDGEAWVLLSGGASSLIGAPVTGFSVDHYWALMKALAGTGLAIGDLNRIRKRFSRWGAGRLAQAILTPEIRGYAISDVPGDEIAMIGSGPLSPDQTSTDDVRRLLQLFGRLGEPAISAAIEFLECHESEPPSHSDPAFDRVTVELIGSNATAVEAAVHEGWQRGYRVLRQAKLLDGEAATAGGRIAEMALAQRSDEPVALVFGGETTVTLPHDHGTGGRCQELALAAAKAISKHRGRSAVVILAAGTDGRDGPSDASGAVVNGSTWSRIAAAGVDPEAALDRHDAYPALDAAGALLRIGPTGTNVMDVVIALVAPEDGNESA